MTSSDGGAISRRHGGGPSVLGWLLPHLMTLVAARGHDPAPIRQLSGLRLRNLEDPDIRIPEAVAQEAWRLAAQITRDPALGLHLAEALPRGALDLIEYAFRSSPSLLAGLERLARYGRVLSDRVAARVEAAGEDVVLVIGDTGTNPLHEARAEFSLAVALRLARDATGVDLTPVRVCFAHAAPASTAEHRRFFRAPVHFASGSNSMALHRADANRPLRGADAALFAIVRRRLEKALSERDAPYAGTMTASVRRILLERLGQADVTPAEVANTLGTSTRTLSRRLADEHTSFRRLLDASRGELAMALLHDRSLSIGDIAFFLQYSEPAAFHRSFKRWTGKTPRAFRERAGAS